MARRPPKQIAEDFFVCKAIELDRFDDFVAAGIKGVIQCRPDEPGLAFGSQTAEKKAHMLGMKFRYVPIRDRLNITARELQAFSEAYQSLPKPAVGYCRTGFRAAVAWGLYELRHRDKCDIRAHIEAVGYDLEPACHMFHAYERKQNLQSRSLLYRIFLA